MQIGQFRDKVNDAMQIGQNNKQRESAAYFYRSIADGRYYSIVAYWANNLLFSEWLTIHQAVGYLANCLLFSEQFVK